MEIPYTYKPHPVTGVYNGKLAIWTFLASEVMLFGGFFSAYILLRVGDPNWPAHALKGSVPLATVNTAVLITSSVTVVLAWAQLKMGDFKKFRLFFLLTLALSGVFLVIKYFEYMHHIHAGELPSANNLFGIYFTMTGLHGLHIVGGMVVMAYLVGPGAKLWETNREWYTNRIECTGLYWHFVDLVWIFLFPSLYLL